MCAKISNVGFRGLGDRLKNEEIMEFCKLWASQIMKSGFSCTNLKQINSWKLLKVLSKHIPPINDFKNAIIIAICFPMIFLCCYDAIRKSLAP